MLDTETVKDEVTPLPTSTPNAPLKGVQSSQLWQQKDTWEMEMWMMWIVSSLPKSDSTVN